jgi:hypothetical protein
MTDNAPGWQPDPTGRHEHRYWDGTQWTDNVSDAGVASTDAYAASAPDVTAEAAAPEATAAGWADPTASMPAQPSEPTAAWPATPAPPSYTAPPAPPSYTPPPATGGPVGPPGSGGSKRGLLVGGGILAAVAVAVAAFLLLGGGDDDGDDVRAQLAAQLRSGSELSASQADCVADHVVDEMGEDSFEGVDFSAEEPPEEIADDLFAAAFESLEACDIDPADFSGGGTDGGDDGGDTDGGDAEEGTYGSDPALDELYDQCEDGDYQACDDLYNESPVGSEYEEFGDTCGDRNEPQGYCVDIYEDGGGDEGSLPDDLPADFEAQLAEAYETSLGLSSEQAECLAGTIADAVESGDLSEAEAMSDIMDYLEECDIDFSDISGG